MALASTKKVEFPENFKFGSASAAYQIEGAWNADGKTASIWDTFTHNRPDMIADGLNGDVAADSYHFYEKDIAALKEVGVSEKSFNFLAEITNFSVVVSSLQIFNLMDSSSRQRNSLESKGNRLLQQSDQRSA